MAEGTPQITAGNPIRICVIDVGTNSFHSVIVDAFANGTFQVLDKTKELVGLGSELVGHHLTETGVRRATEALRRIRHIAEGWQAEDYLAFATSAIREAENGGEFLEYVRDEVGINVRPIDGALEAHLIYQAVRNAVQFTEPTLIVDIGGGSTEFIVADAERPYLETSLKLGSARMTSRFVTTDPVNREEMSALREHFRKKLRPVVESAREHGVTTVIGSSGTMANLAQVYQDRHGDGDRTIYQTEYDASRFREVARSFRRSSRAERLATKGVDEKRVDHVVAGATLVDVLLKEVSVARVLVSPHALREGMVLHYIEKNSRRLEQLAPPGDIRLRSVLGYAMRLGWEESHARHVAALALKLYDGCRPLHEMGQEERQLLEYAAYLHDIGYVISRRKHHKHSYYLIKEADWVGFQPGEVDVIACTARYHRRSMPARRHDEFASLSGPQQRTVGVLASILRLAEALDRGHYQNVQSLDTTITPTDVQIVVRTKGDPEIELWAARRATEMFESTFDRTVTVRAAWSRR